MMTSHLQQDDCDAVTRVLLAQLIQKSVPDVSATEYFKPSQLVDLIHQNTKSFGVFHPGYRAVHANGRFYAGTFAPTPQAKTLSRALHLQDDRAPVTSRFSFGSGNVDDAPNGVVAMATRFYLPDGTYSNLLRDTKKASHVNVEDYDAIYFTGAVCHGPAGLLEVTLDNGESLVKGKNVTGFSRPEEVDAQRADAVPFSRQDALERRGAKYSVADKPFGTHVVTDGRLITGQNPASARAVGEAVVAALQER